MALSDRHSSAIPLLVAGAFFMENLDGTVIATALPQMARSFQVGPVSLNVGMTAYMLTLAVFIPISGWIADRFGARTVFGGAIAVFTVSSVFCGLSNGLPEFVLSRIVQGIGGAMMVPVGRLIVLRSTEKEHLLRATSFITWPGLVAPVLGPPVGGFITTYASWRWIFFLNVPLGLIGIVLSVLLIGNRRADQHRPFDWIGVRLLCGRLFDADVRAGIGRPTTHPLADHHPSSYCEPVDRVSDDLAFRSASDSVDQSFFAPYSDLCGNHQGRLTFSGGDQCDPISFAAPVSDWFWTECV